MQPWKLARPAVPLTAWLLAGGALITSPAFGQDLGVITGRVAVVPSEIGASVRDVETTGADRTGPSTADGAVVDRAADGGPAAAAGIAPGDVIVEFDGERVRGARQLARLVAETPAGRVVVAAVVRERRRVELSVTPRERPARSPVAADRLREIERVTERLRQLGAPGFTQRAIPALPQFDLDAWRTHGRLGVGVQDLNPQLAEFFGVERGVLVTEVRENTAAAAAGLEAGDVVTQVNGNSVRTVAELRRRLAGVEAGGEVTLVVMRERKEVTVSVKLDDPRPRFRGRREPRGVIPL